MNCDVQCPCCGERITFATNADEVFVMLNGEIVLGKTPAPPEPVQIPCLKCTKHIYRIKTIHGVCKQFKATSPPPLVGWCQHCGKPFPLGNPRRIYCLGKCKSAAYRKRQKEKARAYQMIPRLQRIRPLTPRQRNLRSRKAE